MAQGKVCYRSVVHCKKCGCYYMSCGSLNRAVGCPLPACHQQDEKSFPDTVYGALIRNGNLDQLRQVFAGLSAEQKHSLANKAFEMKWQKGLKDITYPLFEAVKQDSTELVKFFLECGADPNTSAGLTNQTTLHLAICREKYSVVAALLDGGANPNWMGRGERGSEALGVAPLSAACRNANADIIQLLVSKGANVNIIDYRGDNCLFYAVRSRRANIVRLLLNLGADPHVVNSYKDTPTSVARSVCPELVPLLEEATSKQSPTSQWKSGRNLDRNGDL